MSGFLTKTIHWPIEDRLTNIHAITLYYWQLTKEIKIAIINPYVLIRLPAVSDHNHERVTVNHWIRVAKNKIFSSIDSELFCKVQEQYEIGIRETLEEIGDNENMKEAFYQFMPSFLSLKRTL